MKASLILPKDYDPVIVISDELIAVNVNTESMKQNNEWV